MYTTTREETTSITTDTEERVLTFQGSGSSKLKSVSVANPPESLMI